MEQLFITDIVEKNKRSNFYYSFLLLPKPKREAINIVYAWCRVADDIVDDEGSVSTKRLRLLLWAKEFELGLAGNSRYQLVNKLSQIINRFNIPLHHFHELIKGMEMDLVKTRYETFEDLKLYCYRVASTVGLICAEIFGYKHEEVKEYAENLGIALQLTNIIRDVAADAKKGRIYLPQRDLDYFGFSEEELFIGKYNIKFKRMMAFQAERARSYFSEAMNHLSVDDRPLFIAALIMQEIYFRLLQDIEKAEYNIFSRRIKVSNTKKLLITFRVWWNNRS
ncbi:MAG: presqualene diphosphate synthase HpnD [Bacteriovoracaceae bacterium]|nr:presqualene diphosphate synthase HpnD [Bacteroidota bacterium]